ncbi:hypothetical protein A2U01_0085604, partial [Trifolium medium]|nr:hypothetical protein [Trifolium medium]
AQRALATQGSAFQDHWRALASPGDYLAQRARTSLSDQLQVLKLRPRKWPWSRPKHLTITNTSWKQPIPSIFIIEIK